MSKVSVIVPVYNVEQYIKRCLKSILDQSWQDFEILCVDDCGQDQSISIIEQMQKEYPQKIKILYGEQNMGLGAARDRGMKAASGEYIAFIDSDDYVTDDYIMTLYSLIEKYECKVSIALYNAFVEGSKPKVVNRVYREDCQTNIKAIEEMFIKRNMIRHHGQNFIIVLYLLQEFAIQKA